MILGSDGILNFTTTKGTKEKFEGGHAIYVSLLTASWFVIFLIPTDEIGDTLFIIIIDKHHVPKVLVCRTHAKEHREVLFGVFTGLALIDDDSHTLNMLQ